MKIHNQGAVESLNEGLKIIVPTKESRSVRFTDLWRVFKDSLRIKLAMLSPFPGKYEKAASISHCQIEANDPLRFFVVAPQFGWYYGNRLFKVRTIINPRIISTGGMLLKSKEGCMSFPFERLLAVKRHQIVELEYMTIFGKKRRKFYEFRAAQIQHECDHMNNITIVEKYYHKKK